MNLIMSLLAGASSNLRLEGLGLSSSLSLASLSTLLCLVVPPAFAVTYADEANLVRLSSGWDMTLKLHWKSVDKRWSVEGYAVNLIKRNVANLMGVNLIARF